MHAVERRVLLLQQILGRADIRRQHALLDQLVRFVALIHVNALDTPRGVEIELRLGRIEFQRTALVARLEQHAIHIEQRQ
jgi:hypothetical protein